MEGARSVAEKKVSVHENFLERIYTPSVIEYLAQVDIQSMKRYGLGQLLVPLVSLECSKRDYPGYRHPPEVVSAIEAYRSIIATTPYFADLSYLVERSWGKLIPRPVTKVIAKTALEIAFWQVGVLEERYTYYVHRLKLMEIVSDLNAGLWMALQPLEEHPSTWNWNGITAARIVRHGGDFGFTQKERQFIEALVVYGSVGDCVHCVTIGNGNTATTLARSIRLKIESGGHKTAEGVSWKAKREAIVHFLLKYTPADEREVTLVRTVLAAEGNIKHAAHVLEVNPGTIYNFLKKAGYQKLSSENTTRKKK